MSRLSKRQGARSRQMDEYVKRANEPDAAKRVLGAIKNMPEADKVAMRSWPWDKRIAWLNNVLNHADTTVSIETQL